MKLLVTTDFSENSKGAIRFANNLAKKSKNVEVVFYHAIHILRPILWNDAFFDRYKREKIKHFSAKLEKFVYSSFGKEVGEFSKIKFAVKNCSSSEKDMIEFARKNKSDFICIATQGGGILRKVIGTHTSYLVNNSKVPLMVIPSHYKAKTLKKAIYLSDFENVKKEVKRISKLSKEISMNLEVLHYSTFELGKKKFENNKELFNTAQFKNIKLSIQTNNLELSLIEKIENYVNKSKPELLILFTNQEKDFFKSIFLSSKSAELTYSTKVPVLIFSK